VFVIVRQNLVISRQGARVVESQFASRSIAPPLSTLGKLVVLERDW
jgi:hypothetical protein